MSPSPQQLEFMKLEYGAMTSKMSELRADLSRTETIYALAMAAIYAWVFTNNDDGSRLWAAALLLPPLIGALGLVRIRTRDRTMKVLEGYICKLESAFYGDAGPGGWEHLYSRKRPMKTYAIARYCVGGIIVAGALLLALWALYDPASFARSPHDTATTAPEQASRSKG